MGENAYHNGQRVEIGTCENMMYLRAQDADKLTPDPGSVHPVKGHANLFYRFPFPNEDHIDPGMYEHETRGLRVPGMTFAALYGPDAEQIVHGKTQFADTGKNGYLVSLPCPESPEADASGLTIHRNGYGGAVKLIGQRVMNGQLWALVRCGGCRRAYRVPPEHKDALVAAFRSAADAELSSFHGSKATADYFHLVANRITEGYDNPPAWVAATATPTKDDAAA